MQPASLSGIDSLSDLRAATSSSPPLDGLSPEAYARGHVDFEACSSQRGLIADWLVARLTSLRPGPLSILAVGCGDGALDSAVAERLIKAQPGRTVRYVGVEPFEQSAAHFAESLGRIASTRLSVDTVVAPFADVSLEENFDVVTFVHSMYYVPDVAEAALAASRLLKPHGQAVVLSAPRGALNRLAGLLAPTLEGHRQWFSDDVRDGLARTGLPVADLGPIDAVVDLTDASDDVLDFTVQAKLTPSLRDLVRRYLADVSLIPGATVVPHPVDTYTLKRDDS